MSGLRKTSIDWFNDIQARKSLETIAPISNSTSASSSSRNETDENGSKQKQPMRQSSFLHVRDLLLLLLIYFSRLAVLEQTVRRLPSEKKQRDKNIFSSQAHHYPKKNCEMLVLCKFQDFCLLA